MAALLKYLVFLTLAATVVLQVQAQTGVHCLRCFSGVCDATNSQLVSLVDSMLGCCECFESLSADECANDPNSTVSAIENTFSSSSLEQCCSNVSTIVTTESYMLNTDPTGDEVTSHTEEVLETTAIDTEIGAGEYIVPSFRVDRNDCIRSILVRPVEGIQSSGNNILTFAIYRTFRVPDDGGGFTSRLYELIKNFSVTLVQQESSNVAIAMLPEEPVCVERGDTLGFSIPPMADFRLGSIRTSNDFFTHNITDIAIEQPCQQLNGFYEVVRSPLFGFLGTLYNPLIKVELGPLDTQPTSVPTTTPLISAPSSDPPQSTTSSPSPPVQSDLALPLYAIIAIGAGSGVCVLLLLVILLLAVCLCVRRSRRRSSHIMNLKSNAETISTLKSQRLQDMSSPDVITVHNLTVEESHDYDMPPPDTKHYYHELEPGVGRVAATGQLHSDPQGYDMGSNMVTYDNPTELLSSTPQTLAQNPLYRTGPEANEEKLFYNPPSQYDVPTALIRAQKTPPLAPIYHELEGPTEKRSRADSSDNIYTETAFGLDSDDLLPHFGSKRSIRSSSVDTTLTVDTSHSIAKDSVSSEAPLLGPHHYYHELESNGSPRPLPRLPEPEGNSSPHPLPRLPGPESEGKSSPRPLPRLPPAITVDGETRGSLTNSLENSTGGHHLYEPGIYVPGGEERQLLGVIVKEEHSEQYKSWKQKSYKAIKNNKQFFEETVVYWEPKNAEQEIYNQFKEKKFREILKDQIEFTSHLGVGQFGSVSKATWSNVQKGSKNVAVKTLKPTLRQDAKVAFLQEAAIMGQFNHSNVVRLYGVVTMSEPIMIVMELLTLGDLDTYLYNNYRPGEMPPPHKKTLLSFSRQVACGMKYLARKNFVHRDLAARNVLVTETLICKIGDFGMSRNLHDSNYYASKGGTVPIKWTAPEGLNYKKFSTASDVYSYGMVLYEIWSLGLKPLAHIKIQNVSQFVTEGKCQHPPPGCPRKIYEIMVHCWAPEQDDRPTFPSIFDLLNGSDIELLRWSETDCAQLSNLAMELGAPLSEAQTMFLELQEMNLVREDSHSGFLGTDV